MWSSAIPRYVTAVKTGSAPPTAPVIGGTLDGYFDFDLARGRAGAAVPVADMGDRDRREVTVEIDGLAMGGDAVGRQRDPAGAESASDGRATFVPLAAPGERVRARIEREKGRVAWGELTAIERPGPDRVPPPCPLFGSCGGCQWQHVTIDAQRAAKKAIVERALGIDHPAGARGGSRLRLPRSRQAHGGEGRDARVSRAPLARRRRGEPPRCPLFGPELARALPALRALARGLAAGDRARGAGGRRGRAPQRRRAPTPRARRTPAARSIA